MKNGSKRYSKPNIVFFDLETTGFDRPIRPVQIGAIGMFYLLIFVIRIVDPHHVDADSADPHREKRIRIGERFL